MIDQSSLIAALDAIEEADARNIAWGLADESWTKPQIVALLQEGWGGEDIDACITNLVEAHLLLELPRGWPPRYRTRMAESVRLFTHLRQLFADRPWRSGSRLVSDYRFLRRPRHFPKRDISAAVAVASLRDHAVAEAVTIEVERILGPRLISRFQLDATAAVLSALRSGEDAGIVVGAGTGSGKTLAFYLPALATLSSSSGNGPRVMAIYPRNELLKDQLASALNEAKRLRAAGGRTLTVGAYFGPTPRTTKFDPDPRDGWYKRGDQWICPYLRCIAAAADGDCGGELAWLRPRAGGQDKLAWGHLQCRRCDSRVHANEFRLTRDSMQAEPPDVLFTTTEMLNICLADGWSQHVFGIGPRAIRIPKLVLLDEIHTYSGTSGAQVAYLLRRWRNLLGHNVTWVGLSATLANAADFMSDLCAVAVERVADLRPDPADMVQQGAEYQLLLRGDPASQSALLSTTIQSLMLLRRILDENGSSTPAPYGTRVFAFLENLDLVNRLYRQLLDAEGRNPVGQREASRAVLAALRLPDYASRYMDIGDEAEWDRDGQHWWLTEALGFGERALAVSRTSSQDAGVSASTDVVIASSALEVGYDDPRVGAVLQHKAPRDIAQFLQRRGRAGRLQSQRPWTVVVLSDYGRDRIVFQSYESILDPSVPAMQLPMGNQSVRKMQAAMCLLDWASGQLNVSQYPHWDTRRAWSSPTASQHARESIVLLLAVLDGGSAQQELSKYVATSLGLHPAEVQSLCWEHPRSLMLEVVPTAYRRLQSNWATASAQQLKPGTDNVARQPLPEYIPATLFSDLELPEVRIEPPEGYDPAAETSIAIGMALRELTPGKVTLRWAVRKVRGLWVEAPPSGVVALEDGLAYDGAIATEIPIDCKPIPVVRPLIIRPSIPPPSVRPTSNGRLQWKFAADFDAVSTPIPRPRTGRLNDVVTDVCVFLNSDRGPLLTWRYALSGTAELATQQGRERRDYTFTWHGKPAAVGFASSVDAVVVTAKVPDDVAVFDLSSDTVRLRQLRTDRFHDITREELETAGVGTFAAGWIAETVLAIVSPAVIAGASLGDLRTWSPSEWRHRAEPIIDAVLLIADSSDPDEMPLRQTILDSLGEQHVVSVIGESLETLFGQPGDQWLPWIRRRYLQTLAAAWQEGAQQACPDFNVEADAAVDIVDSGGPQARIILSDVSPGGGALAESLTRRIADDPRRFELLVAAALEPSEAEQVDASVRNALQLLEQAGPVSDAAVAFRSAGKERLTAWQQLAAKLADDGVPRTHANLAALALRIFRPGSGPESDALLRTMLRRWDEIDSGAGFGVDPRSVAILLATDDELVEALRRISGAGAAALTTTTVQSVIQSLLWPRAVARRAQSLRVINYFVANPPATERTLLRNLLPAPATAIDVGATDWRDALADALRVTGTARLISSRNNVSELAAALRGLLVTPLDMEWLFVYPQVVGVSRDHGQVSLLMTSREAPQ
ncbi:MAG: hypothetical protein QOD39_2387 [Mycobacterium sp.]|jgi:hypothetical protein|nr:hypothetical protein [Mycobacterium sp.]